MSLRSQELLVNKYKVYENTYTIQTTVYMLYRAIEIKLKRIARFPLQWIRVES